MLYHCRIRANGPARLAWVAILALVTSSIVGRGQENSPTAAVTPVRHAHAHNDYEHKRPLFDALEQGFCSVEADIFLVDKELRIGHTQLDLRPERTLESLYLKPLRERVQANKGRVYPDGPPFFLLIDVKTEAKATYTALDPVLARYGDMLSCLRDGKYTPNAVTVIISGNCDRETITNQSVRYAGIDGRPPDLESTTAAHLIPWISANWTTIFRWRGDGPMPEAERAKLREFVGKAHDRGRLVRFWSTAENPLVWKELRSAGVDLINTDKLSELRQFLLKESQQNQKP